MSKLLKKLGIFLALARKANGRANENGHMWHSLFIFQYHNILCVDFQYSPFSYCICSRVCFSNRWCVQKPTRDAFTWRRISWSLLWFIFVVVVVHLLQSTITWKEILSEILPRSSWPVDISISIVLIVLCYGKTAWYWVPRSLLLGSGIRVEKTSWAQCLHAFILSSLSCGGDSVLQTPTLI